ncbi:MAG: deoxyhypusine synthase [Candidatus Altiarchaeales archaeon]|nr:deoxyhypusine synthase [Candidatus Altiarchaeales archaeon]
MEHEKLGTTGGLSAVKDISLKKYPNILKDYLKCGFQATNLGSAGQTIKQMIEEDYFILLSFTANMMASGLRGAFKDVIQTGSVDAVITTGGSIDHDIIRSYNDYFLGDFQADDNILHEKGINRLGNILIPNEGYVSLEEKIRPLIRKASKENDVWSPKDLTAFLAENLEPKDNFIQRAADRLLPVYSPGFIDSAIGLQIFFHKKEGNKFILDVSKDLVDLENRIMRQDKVGAIVCGGGISKHHLIGSTLLRGGLDKAVYITTAQEYDGSLSGAQTREAKSWGKIAEKADTQTVYGEATLVLPLLLSTLM